MDGQKITPLIGWLSDLTRIGTPATGRPSGSTAEPSTRWSIGSSVITIGSVADPVGVADPASRGADSPTAPQASSPGPRRAMRNVCSPRASRGIVRRPPASVAKDRDDWPRPRVSTTIPATPAPSRSTTRTWIGPAGGGLSAAVGAGRGPSPRPTPAIPIPAAVSRTIDNVAIRRMSCLRISAPARIATAAGAAAAIVPPPPTAAAARAIAAASPGGIGTGPVPMAIGAIPRRSNRRRSRSRPRASRLWSVPTGHPISPAACSYECPSRSQRTTAARKGSGRPSSSSWISGRGSGGAGATGSDRSDCSRRRRSSSRRRARSRRARAATRRATPYSHPAKASPRRIDPARRARTRKAAWQASSASWRSPRIERQTPSTIGPCRSTIAAKAASAAASPRPRRKHSNNWPSVHPESVPTPKSVRSEADSRPASPQDSVLADPRIAMAPRPDSPRPARQSGHDAPAVFPISRDAPA